MDVKKIKAKAPKTMEAFIKTKSHYLKRTGVPSPVLLHYLNLMRLALWL